MKTATLPSLRVEPELREAAESVLEEGESLSAFMEKSLRRNIHHRKVRKEFVERALRAEREAKESGRYHTIDEVMTEMRAVVEQGSSSKPRS